MQYPINAEQSIADFEKAEGPASEAAKEMISIYVKAVNKAYEVGYSDGRKDAAK